MFPWSFGVVFTRLKRQQFDEGLLGEVILSQRVICQDEMQESVESENFRQRLREIFPVHFNTPRRAS